MEAEDVQCHLLYRNERVTIARECGQMLTEERAVSGFFIFVGFTGTKMCRVLLSRNSRVAWYLACSTCAIHSHVGVPARVQVYLLTVCVLFASVEWCLLCSPRFVQLCGFRTRRMPSQPDQGDDTRGDRHRRGETASGKDSRAGQGSCTEAGHNERHLRASKPMGRL